MDESLADLDGVIAPWRPRDIRSYPLDFEQQHVRLGKTGKLLGDKTEILSGLEPGDPVVTSDASQLSDGQPVTSQP